MHQIKVSVSLQNLFDCAVDLLYSGDGTSASGELVKAVAPNRRPRTLQLRMNRQVPNAPFQNLEAVCLRNLRKNLRAGTDGNVSCLIVIGHDKGGHQKRTTRSWFIPGAVYSRRSTSRCNALYRSWMNYVLDINSLLNIVRGTAFLPQVSHTTVLRWLRNNGINMYVQSTQRTDVP